VGGFASRPFFIGKMLAVRLNTIESTLINKQ
jgi:hypothetical protein